MKPFVSSDPGAWMRPYYAELSGRPGFANLAPALRFRALMDAIAQDHPGRAAEIRDSNATTQSAILGWLTDVTKQKPAAREMELWRVGKGERELRCIAVYLPTGIDLRLMERDEFRRTQLNHQQIINRQMNGFGWCRLHAATVLHPASASRSLPQLPR